MYIYNWYSGCHICIFMPIYSSIACQQEHCMNNTPPMCLYRQMYNVETFLGRFLYYSFVRQLILTNPSIPFCIGSNIWCPKITIAKLLILAQRQSMYMHVFCPCVTVKHWLPFTASELIWQFHHLLARLHRTHFLLTSFKHDVSVHAPVPVGFSFYGSREALDRSYNDKQTTTQHS